jgi:2-phospho-L-lactate/phosphoenolpyruvate guanylyltransferase
VTPVTGWSVVVPLKPLQQAKSRLLALPAPLRQALVVAMSRDVCDAVLACQDVHEVLVVTRDPRWRSRLCRPRVRFLADSPTDSLNDALRRGAADCRTTRHGCGVASLTADLPALRPQELGRALSEGGATPTSFVPDAHGEGTTLFAARSGAEFCPQYGIGSRVRHIEAGAREVLLPGLDGIRQDVDTVEDLKLARALGLGPHTRAVVSAVMEGLSPAHPRTLVRIRWSSVVRFCF